MFCNCYVQVCHGTAQYIQVGPTLTTRTRSEYSKRLESQFPHTYYASGTCDMSFFYHVIIALPACNVCSFILSSERVSALPERWKLSNLTVRFVEINGLVHEACKFGILLFWSGFCRSLSPRVRVRKIENDWMYMRHSNLEFHHSDDLPEFKK